MAYATTTLPRGSMDACGCCSDCDGMPYARIPGSPISGCDTCHNTGLAPYCDDCGADPGEPCHVSCSSRWQ